MQIPLRAAAETELVGAYIEVASLDSDLIGDTTDRFNLYVHYLPYV